MPVLRDFHAEDQVAVRALILAGLVDHWGAIDETLNRDLDDIAGSYATGRTVVVELCSQVVGTGTVRPRPDGAAEIVRMSVASTHRRNGFGRMVVEALAEIAESWGASRVILETSAHWEATVAFYVACGFHITHHAEGEFGRDTWFERGL